MNKKTQLISSVKHDIKTPISSIVGYTSLIERLTNDNKIVNYCKSINYSCTLITSLLEDILDYSLFLDENIKVEHDIFSISKVIEELISVFSLRIKQKNQKFLVEVFNKDEEYFLGDKKLILKALLNLINNSIKYTEENGTISFSTYIVNKNNNQSMLTFIIQDNGIGIDEKSLHQIFDPYKRGDKINVITNDGIGLGLYITKSIINLLNGTIKVESTLDKGTKFIIELILNKAHKTSTINFSNIILLSDYETKITIENYYQNIKIKHYLDSISFIEELKNNNDYIAIIDEIYINETLINVLKNIKKKNSYIFILSNKYEDLLDGNINKPFFASSIENKIKNSKKDFDFSNISFLLAEDNPINQEIAKDTITINKGNIKIVSNGLECINLLKDNNDFDFILIDINMPILNGIDTIKMIKEQNLLLKKTKIIILSSNDEEEYNDVIYDYYLKKPINVSKLFWIIKNAKQKPSIK